MDKPERRLQKGSGFHMDIVLMSLVNALCGLFGAPWQCVATVRSVSHVAALTVMSTTHAPGDKPHIVEVKGEPAPASYPLPTRITTFTIHIVYLCVLQSND